MEGSISKVLKIAAVVVAVAAITIATAGVGTAPALSAASTTVAVGGTAFTTAGFAVAATGASIFGISAGTLLLASSALSLASGLLAKKPSIAATGAQTQFNADPNAGIPYLMGRTGTGSFIVFRSNADGWSDKTPNDLDDFNIVHSLGPIQGYESFKADQVTVTFDGSGNGSGGFSGFMWQKSQLGACPEAAALAVAAGASSRPTGWGTDAKLSGLATSQWRLRFDAKGNHYQSGTPKPQWIILGVKVYDPRLDSTYPGGSGSCRANNEATWVYSQNPYLHGLTWLIGRTQNGQRVMGVGMPLNGIIVSSFVEGANIADANGWKIGGVVYSTDNKYEVLKAILQAGGGEPMRLGAQIGCLINTPRVSLATITIDDLAQGEVSVQATQPQRSRINGVIPRYRSEDHDWEIVPGAPVRVASHVTEDGGQRTREIEYPLVQVEAGQPVVHPAQLARYDIENAREFGPISIPLKLRWYGYRPGDCITANLPESGLSNQPILLLNRGLNPGDAVVTITARSETAGKHPFALGQTTTAPPTPSVSGPPLVPTPDSDDWAIVDTEISSGGVTVPALVIEGDAPTSIEQIVFEYRLYTGPGMDPEAGWIAAGLEPPQATSKAIATVQSGTDYQASIRYRARGVSGGRLILGPATTADYLGVQGPPGDDGSPTYIWVAYANSADGTTDFTNGAPGTRAYLGLAPNKSSPVESSDPADYIWSKMQGDQGDQGIPGEPGEDGTPRYIWVAYANSADGTTDFTNGAPGSRTYLGLAPNKTTATESSDPADYSWSKIQGPQGDQGDDGISALDVSASPPVVAVASTNNGTPKAALPGFAITVKQAGSDVTSAATFGTPSVSNMTGVSGGAGVGNNTIAVSGMSADSGFIEVPISHGGASSSVRVPYTKVRDALPYVNGSDITISNAPSGSTYGEVARVTLTMGPNGTLDAAYDVSFFATSGGAINVESYMEISVNGGGFSALTSTGGTADATVPASENGNVFNSISASGSSLGISSSYSVIVRLMMRELGTGNMTGATGNLTVAWTG